MPFPTALRVCLVVTTTIAAFAIGFVFWSTLFGLLFAAIATSGTFLALVVHLVSRFRKRRNEFGDTFAALAFAGFILLAGWWVRGELREEAMIAESLRLLNEAELFRRRQGHIARSISSLHPTDSTDRIVAWIAGTAVRYSGTNESYTIVRGEFIDGYIYSSKEAVWRHSKI